MTENRLAVLAAMPATITQIMARCDRTRATIAAHIRALHAAEQIHIGDWSVPEGRGAAGAIYHAGPGEDVPCPKPRRLASATHRKASVAAEIARIPPRDALTTALFGPA